MPTPNGEAKICRVKRRLLFRRQRTHSTGLIPEIQQRLANAKLKDEREANNHNHNYLLDSQSLWVVSRVDESVL